MNAWLVAAGVLVPGGMGPCVWRACRGTAAGRLPAVALAGVVTVAVFLVMARGLERPSYADLALVGAVLAPAGTLVFARCLAGGGGRRPGEWRRAGAD